MILKIRQSGGLNTTVSTKFSFRCFWSYFWTTLAALLFQYLLYFVLTSVLVFRPLFLTLISWWKILINSVAQIRTSIHRNIYMPMHILLHIGLISLGLFINIRFKLYYGTWTSIRFLYYFILVSKFSNVLLCINSHFKLEPNTCSTGSSLVNSLYTSDHQIHEQSVLPFELCLSDLLKK